MVMILSHPLMFTNVSVCKFLKYNTFHLQKEQPVNLQATSTIVLKVVSDNVKLIVNTLSRPIAFAMVSITV